LKKLQIFLVILSRRVCFRTDVIPKKANETKELLSADQARHNRPQSGASVQLNPAALVLFS
jgi:hypothetical protein